MNQDSLEKMELEMRLKNYSRRTIKSYLACVRSFLESGESDPKKFLMGKIEEGKAPETVNVYLQSIKFYYKVMGRSAEINIPFSRRNKKLPVVLSREEVQRIIDSISNLKHKTMISLSYGSGLRVSEVVNLRAGDLDFDRNLLIVREGKGSKDRVTLFPDKLRFILEQMSSVTNRDEFLFESERGGKLTSRTAQKVFENGLKKSGVLKHATFHSLRHSFATHCLENGVDIRYIQGLLGHSNIRTTQRYTQISRLKVSGIQSPL